MEIGQKVYWLVDNQKHEGLFMQIINDKAEIICYSMNNIKCHLRVFVDLNSINATT
jgi:hypothetical protein